MHFKKQQHYCLCCGSYNPFVYYYRNKLKPEPINWRNLFFKCIVFFICLVCLLHTETLYERIDGSGSCAVAYVLTILFGAYCVCNYYLDFQLVSVILWFSIMVVLFIYGNCFTVCFCCITKYGT